MPPATPKIPKNAFALLTAFASLALALMPVASLGAAGDQRAVSRKLLVNPHDPAAFPTLAAAAAAAGPGDTIWLAPDSGPYREEFFLKTSGTPDAPITIEGNGNEITGFDKLVFSSANAGPPLTARTPAPWPFVLRHNGKRILQDPKGGQFTAGSEDSVISYDEGTQTLTLGPAADPEGWEISARYFSVRIENASWHRYRNIVATGALNDGFNLHGRCEGQVFENIVGRHNLDEGFSAHEGIVSVIKGGNFYENDNGIVNINQSRTTLIDVNIWNNLGIGFELHDQASVEATRLAIWGNGMRQFSLIGNDTKVTGSRIDIYRNANRSQPWLTYNESAKQTQPPVTLVGDAARALAAAGTINVHDMDTPFTHPTP